MSDNPQSKTAARRIAIIGATSAIAEHSARLWLAQGPAQLCLAGRDAARLQRVADDLRVRSPQSQIQVVPGDMASPVGIERMVQDCCADGVPDVVLIAHGLLPDQAQCQRELGAGQEALLVNGVSPALFAEGFAGRMLAAGRGTVGIIGSVAGDRGRRSNYSYGAAKALLERYAQGLQHRCAGSAVRVVLIKPGPTETPMTAHLKGRVALAPVEQVARDTVAAITRGRAVAYTPARWRLIMRVVQHLPRMIFNRLDI